MTEQEKERGRFWRAAWFLPLLFLLSAGWSIYPAEQRGANIRVWTEDGVKYEGELLKVTDTSLVLIQSYSNALIHLEISKIDSITIAKQTNLARSLVGSMLSTLSGSVIGGALAFINGNSGYNLYIKSPDSMEYAMAEIGCICAGAALGLFSDSLNPNKFFSFYGKNESQKKQILDSLQSYSSENFNPDKQQRKFLGRFQISWQPFIHPSPDLVFSGKVNRFPSSSIWQEFPLSENDLSHSTTQCLRFQVNYALSKWISAGIDIASLGEREFDSTLYEVYQIPGYIVLTVVDKFNVKTAMFGLSLSTPTLEGQPSGLKLEFGMGPAWNNLKIGTKYYTSFDLPPSTTASASWTSLAYKAGATWEFYPSRFLSMGLYCHYLYIPTTIPEMGISIPNVFDWNFQQSLPVNVPSQQVNLGGIIIGALVRFR